MILHGILATNDVALHLMKEIMREATISKPNSEPKECWMDRRAYSLHHKKKIAIYQEEWK